MARVDFESSYTLGASTIDFIEINGKRRTVAKCLPLYPSDEGKGIIRVDGIVRNNAGIVIDDTVAIKKIKVVAAEKIVVAPLEDMSHTDERYLTDALESVPLMKGDNIMVPYFGGRLTFQVIGVIPSADAVLVTQNTVFNIREGSAHEDYKISAGNPEVKNFDREEQSMKMRQVMNNNDELKNKITNWMLEEGGACSQINDPNVDFRLRIKWGYTMDVVKAKGLKRIVYTADLSFEAEDFSKVFKKLSDEEKREFLADLRIHLSKFPMDYTIHPETVDSLESISFSRPAYLEDIITKTSFMESLDVIYRGMNLASIFCTRRLNLDTPKPDYYV